MKVVIAGGTGFLGRALVDALVARGDEVTVVSRRARPAEGSVRFVGYDQLPEEADAVINLAGEWVAGLWTPAKKRAILESRIEATRRIVDWMLDLPGKLPVLLNASAVGFYGDRPGEVLTEESAYDPGDKFRGRVCRAWEAETTRASDFGARVVLLRIGGVLDSQGGLIGLVLPLLKRAPFAVPPMAKAHLAWISLDDTVRMILFAMDRDAISGPMNVTAPHPTTYGELVDRMARALGKPSFGSMPKWLLRAVLWENSEAVTDTQDIRPAKALEHGFEFLHPRIEDWVRTEFAAQLVGIRRGGENVGKVGR